ncbi:hypothetical protein VaNZ11_004279 [Volvox africanus]|uniref:Uncharacterized protein n=1 Tax=Volvox africanus TaxID=51714 RepID=A0ABQ5RWI4_9CHLO|nr:hypothetical protein VaNZ11_004279 [Volvox africanus]
MCDNLYIAINHRFGFGGQTKSWFASSTDDSFPEHAGGVEQIDDNYLSTRWSHTAKFLREFTQRKAAQAEEIRRQRAYLQDLSVEERSAALGPTISPQQSEGSLEKNALEPLESKPLWSDAISEQVSIPPVGAPKLSQSTTRGHGALHSVHSGGAGGSTTSLDVLLQSVLQRSTAVSTKLTKTYAQSVDVEEPDSGPPPRISHTSMKKGRGDRGRSQSRIQRQHTHHQEEYGRKEPSPPPHAHQQQQQQGRPYGEDAGVSPGASRSSSPGSLGYRESTRGSLPQLPPAASPVQPGTPGQGKEQRPPESQQTEQAPLPPPQSRLQPHGGLRAQQLSQQAASPGDQDKQQLQEQGSLSGTVPCHKRSSLGSFKVNVAARRDPVGIRAVSQSLDGVVVPPRRRSDDPCMPEGHGTAGGRTAAAQGAGSHSRRRVSGSGVRLPHLHHVGSRSFGAISAVERRGQAFRGPKSLRGSASGSSQSSGEGDPSRSRVELAMRRPLGSLRIREQSSIRRSGSLPRSILSPRWGTGQSSWAKSTTSRELIFTQF